MTTEIKEVRNQSVLHTKVQNVMYLVNEQSLQQAHKEQKKNKARGIDGVNKEEYTSNEEENIKALYRRMKTFSYKPKPVKRVYIPKSNGKMRPLGIPAYEDRLVQSVMASILNEVYEPRFLDCSFGFRPRRNAHDVIRYVNQRIMINKVNYVLEADIKGFFDNVNHDWMIKFLEHDIEDKNFIRYTRRLLESGVMEEGKYLECDKGTIQGGQISPILANIYLHYVLDLWLHKAIAPRMRGEIYYIRYADDFLIMFQYQTDADRVMKVLGKRLGKFGLELATEKTRIIPFGRFRGTKENFDFLGFTFINSKTRNGKYRVAIITNKKKLQAKRQNLRMWLSNRKDKDVTETMKLIAASLLGHYAYYGINGNLTQMGKFYRYAEIETFNILNRRSQRKSLTWEKFRKIWQYHIPRPHITKNIWADPRV